MVKHTDHLVLRDKIKRLSTRMKDKKNSKVEKAVIRDSLKKLKAELERLTAHPPPIVVVPPVHPPVNLFPVVVAAAVAVAQPEPVGAAFDV